MNILAFNGSPRKKGNTSLLLHELLRGAREDGIYAEEIIAEKVNLKYCKGCLRCNLIKRCSIKGDDWSDLSSKILSADALVFASPIYFHHITAPLKKILDRFRSFLNVQITEHGLKHTPWHEWKKQFVLLLCLGSSDDTDAKPVIDLFKFITTILGAENRLHSIVGTRLAAANQIKMTKEELANLYPKLHLPYHLVNQDYQRNQTLLKKCYELGKELGRL
jgi:NAD(P)H-dependent FMN reductase